MKVSFSDKKRKYAAVSHNKIRYQEKENEFLPELQL